MDYWEECISEAFEVAGIDASKTQIEAVVNWVKGAHDQFCMAHGYDAIPNPLQEEHARLSKELNERLRRALIEVLRLLPDQCYMCERFDGEWGCEINGLEDNESVFEQRANEACADHFAPRVFYCNILNPARKLVNETP